MTVSKFDIFRVGAPGQIPETSPMPSVEMIADGIANRLHVSADKSLLQSERAAPRKPIVDKSQKTLAKIAVALDDSEGISQKRTGTA